MKNNALNSIRTAQKKSKTPKIPRAPAHLRKDGRELWKRVLIEYELPPEALVVLALACEAQDRCQDARRMLDKYGTVFKDRFGQIKPNPLLIVERDSRAAVCRCLAQLKLDLEPLHAMPGRPPGR